MSTKIRGQRRDMKTETRNKDHKITKIIRKMQQKYMSNLDSTKTWEHGPSTPFLETVV